MKLSKVLYICIIVWAFGFLSGPPGFTCWTLLLQYSVLFTVESLSLLFLLVIDKLGFFHANKISMCLDPHLN